MTIEDTSSYLDAYRKKIAAPRGAREQNLEEIRKRAAQGEQEVEQAPRVRRAAALLGLKSKLVVAVLATAGLGTVAVGTAIVTSEDDAPLASVPANLPQEDTIPAAPPPSPRSADPLPTAAPTPLEPSQPQGEPLEAKAPAPAPRAKSLPPSEPAAPVDSLEEELHIMKAARSHLDAERYDQANTLLREHARRFPRGALSEERAAWLAIVGCKRGIGQATAAARAFVLAHPHSPLLAKVRKGCDLP